MQWFTETGPRLLEERRGVAGAPGPRGLGRAPPAEPLCSPRRRMPSLLEYLSYNCNFMGILAGPLCSYRDYITFIEGRVHPRAPPGAAGKEDLPGDRAEPSPNVSSPQRGRQRLLV